MRAFLRHLLAILALPGVVAVLVPCWLAWQFEVSWHPPAGPSDAAVQLLGAVLSVIGLALFVASVYRFGFEGGGTLGPWDPPRRLVVGGPYRFVRNPMISGVIFVLFGEALVLWSLPHAVWAVLVLASVLALGALTAYGLFALAGLRCARSRGIDPAPLPSTLWTRRPRSDAWVPAAIAFGSGLGAGSGSSPSLLSSSGSPRRRCQRRSTHRRSSSRSSRARRHRSARRSSVGSSCSARCRGSSPRRSHPRRPFERRSPSARSSSGHCTRRRR